MTVFLNRTWTQTCGSVFVLGPGSCRWRTLACIILTPSCQGASRWNRGREGLPAACGSSSLWRPSTETQRPASSINHERRGGGWKRGKSNIIPRVNSRRRSHLHRLRRRAAPSSFLYFCRDHAQSCKSTNAWQSRCQPPSVKCFWASLHFERRRAFPRHHQRRLQLPVNTPNCSRSGSVRSSERHEIYRSEASFRTQRPEMISTM